METLLVSHQWEMAIGAGTICAGAPMTAFGLCVLLETLVDVENPLATLLRMLVVALSKAV